MDHETVHLPKQVSALDVLRHNRWYFLVNSRVKVKVLFNLYNIDATELFVCFCSLYDAKAFFFPVGNWLCSRSQSQGLVLSRELISHDASLSAVPYLDAGPNRAPAIVKNERLSWNVVHSLSNEHTHIPSQPLLDCIRCLCWIYSCMF